MAQKQGIMALPFFIEDFMNNVSYSTPHPRIHALRKEAHEPLVLPTKPVWQTHNLGATLQILRLGAREYSSI